MDKHLDILTQLLEYRYKRKSLVQWALFDEHQKQIRVKTWIYRNLKD